MPRTKGAGVPELGQRIERLMQEKGIDSSTLAGRTGISVSYLSRILRGEVVNPTIDFVVRLAAALGVTESELVRHSVQPRRRRPAALAGPAIAELPDSDQDQGDMPPSITVGQTIDTILDEEGLTLEERTTLGETLLFSHTRQAARLMRLKRGGER